MRIVDSTGPSLLVYLSPDDCLLLADACKTHADHVDPGDIGQPQTNRTEGALFGCLAHMLEGYAIVGQAMFNSDPDELRSLDLGAIRREWGVLPNDHKAADRRES